MRKNKAKTQSAEGSRGAITISKRRKLKPHCWEPNSFGGGRRRPDPRGRVILDPEAARPAWDSDTKTALSSLLPLHSLTTGYDAASSGARPDSHRRKTERWTARGGGREGVRKIKRSRPCVETCCLQL